MSGKKQPVIRDILFATDFSSEAEPAGRFAAALAGALKARLHILHVAASRKGAAEPRLRKLADALSRAVDVKTVLEIGSPAPRIVRYARDNDIAMIVVGTHGRTGFSRALLGSVAEHVARIAPCAVLTVPPPPRLRLREEAPPETAEAGLGRCVVCARPAQDQICPACRDRIRAEAVDRKFLEDERKART